MSSVKPLRMARVLFLLCLTLVIILQSLPAMAQTCPHDGDVNQDSHLTPADALLTFQQFLGIANPSLNVCQQGHADVNQDGNLTPADALCIFQKFLGLQSCLQAPLDLEPFKELARYGGCANRRNQLFLIDNKMVFLAQEGDCADARFRYSLYGADVEELLCTRSDSIAGPLERCLDGSWGDLFNTILMNLDDPELGVGMVHQVEEIPF